jgi:hypothetical protein
LESTGKNAFDFPLDLRPNLHPMEGGTDLMTWSAFKRSRQDSSARTAVDDLLRRARSRIPANEVIQIRIGFKVLAGRVV